MKPLRVVVFPYAESKLDDFSGVSDMAKDQGQNHGPLLKIFRRTVFLFFFFQQKNFRRTRGACAHEPSRVIFFPFLGYLSGRLLASLVDGSE